MNPAAAFIFESNCRILLRLYQGSFRKSISWDIDIFNRAITSVESPTFFIGSENQKKYDFKKCLDIFSEKRRGSDSILNIALHIKDRANQISIMFYHKFHLRKRQKSYIGNGLAHNCRGHLLKSERFERRARAWMWKGRLSADKWCQALKCQLCIWCLKTQLFPLVSVNSLCICATHQGVKNFISTINPRLSYLFGSFHANPKEFLHHCESHARLPEGRLETHFFFFFYQKTSVSSKQCHHLSIC